MLSTPGYPLIGNLPQIPLSHSWLQFHTWSQTYGPIFRLTLAGAPHVVLSTEKAANDLLRERGTLYSSRPQLPAATVLLGDRLRPLFLPYNDLWRRGRKLMHHLCMPSAAASYEGTQRLESTVLLAALLRDPAGYETHFERFSSGLIFRLGFGKTLEEAESAGKGGASRSLTHRILEVGHTLERVASPGAYLVDTFPVLMRVPDWAAGWKRELKWMHARELALFRELLYDVKKEMEERKDQAVECWERAFLEKQDEYGLSDDEGAYVVGTLFEAGSGTTSAAMMSWTLAMLLHPQEYRRVQQEVDRVVGEDRMPDFGDMESLSTVRAVIKETLRWRPVTAGGVPHQLVKDDIYQGYFLQAGTVVHFNQWAIHRDPDLYPDPETFNPSRWLDPKYPTYREPLAEYPNLKNFSAFGFGRRFCPGHSIAERSLNLLVARIAWACDISKSRDEFENEIPVPDYDYISGFNTQPKWFPFNLRPRSARRQKMVDEAAVEARRKDTLKVA
ncbi:cytochrome P450 [Viridothelium virens]|uniref:Cytochrome P450 n=1 Tax=Viridothelium virens TaxID=1048519 RepID=A0A6A6HIT9_VIRVR|nr:cytochrome P450 [Viridothelium virens]